MSTHTHAHIEHRRTTARFTWAKTWREIFHSRGKHPQRVNPKRPRLDETRDFVFITDSMLGFRRSVISATRQRRSGEITHQFESCHQSHKGAYTNLSIQQSPLFTYSNDRREDEDKRHRQMLISNTWPITVQRATFHSTPQAENASIALILGSVALTAKAAQLGARAYKDWKENLPEAPPEGGVGEQSEPEQEGKARATGANKEEERENIFKKFFGIGVGGKYYEGGFESNMTRKEAALILGVRETASAQRIKNAHRKILILNHPDTGGSTYIASKVNEAKELLLKGK